MPLSRESYESGRILPRAEILAYLRMNRHNSYTIDEIYRDSRTTLEYSIEQLREVVNELIKEGLVESKTIEGVEYFVAIYRIGFRPQR